MLSSLRTQKLIGKNNGNKVSQPRSRLGEKLQKEGVLTQELTAERLQKQGVPTLELSAEGLQKQGIQIQEMIGERLQRQGVQPRN